MSSLSTQNRLRIISCLKTIETSLADDADLVEQAGQVRAEAEHLHSELSSNRVTLKPAVTEQDDDFVNAFLSSGCFSKDLETLKESEGAAWGSADLNTLAESLKDIPRGMSDTQKELFISLV